MVERMLERPVKLPKRGIFVGRLDLTPDHGPVGTKVSVAGADLPPSARLQLIWESYDARWRIEQHDDQDWNEFRGIDFDQRFQLISAVETDEQGRFQTSFIVHEGYGGVHDVYLIDPQLDQKVNKAGFRVDPNAMLTPQSGPLGSSITVTMTGLNAAHPMEGWYRLWYDNMQVGLLTAVTTRGTARAVIPTIGRVGKHIIEIKTGAMGQASFLQVDVSPFAYLPIFKFEFELTPGQAVLPPPIEEQLQMEVAVPEPDTAVDKPMLWTDYTNVPAGSALTLYGRGFPVGIDLELVWVDVESNDMNEWAGDSSHGLLPSEHGRVISHARTDNQGRFVHHFVPESAQGGARAVEAHANGKLLVKTYVRITPRPHRLTRKVYTVGDLIELEIDGVGWTEIEKIFCLVYDNSYIGYVCGNDLMGKVKPKLSATGEPGWHFIQVYSAIYKNRNYADAFETPFLYRVPLLNWEDLPHGFHCTYAFEVTEAK